MNYTAFGAAVSEVEIDILSGDRRILRTDIHFDCGQSLNPMVDMGQVKIYSFKTFTFSPYRPSESHLWKIEKGDSSVQ